MLSIHFHAPLWLHCFVIMLYIGDLWVSAPQLKKNWKLFSLVLLTIALGIVITSYTFQPDKSSTNSLNTESHYFTESVHYFTNRKPGSDNHTWTAHTSAEQCWGEGFPNGSYTICSPLHLDDLQTVVNKIPLKRVLIIVHGYANTCVSQPN